MDQASTVEDVPAHLECAICWKLLLEPVSVPCGHTFCQGCLNQALGYRNVCSVCRAPVPPGQAVNILIRSMISEQYPRALAKRRQEQEEEIREEEQTSQLERQRDVAGEANAATVAGGSGGNEGHDVFFLPILRNGKLLLPQSRMDQELSAHEEELLQYALQGGRRVCVLKAGEDLGVCMIVEDFYPAMGHHPSRARLVGKFRARLVEPPQLHEAGFELGQFEAVFDTPLPVGELAPVQEGESSEETAAVIVQKCIELMEGQLQMLGSGSRYVFTQSCGELPALFRRRPGSVATSADMEGLSFWLVGALIMDASRKQHLMQTTDTKERLLACHDTMQSARSKSVLNLPGSDSWMHPGQSSWSSMVLLVVIFALLVAKACGVFDSMMPRQRGLPSGRFM
mmetsp:Transcript_83937/g.102820  ORF Transcript_83937/g.102820 Transcript_83937/m.102820 type:complete len:398 (+) Transcript_83937:48-1241(+)